MGILATGTFRANRKANCSLPSEKDLKNKGRGTWGYRTDQSSARFLIKQYNKKCVLTGSAHAGVTDHQN